MSQLGLRFVVQPSKYEEPEPLKDQDVRHYVSQLAWNKAWDVARATKNGWILGADTAGDLDGLVGGQGLCFDPRLGPHEAH